MKHNFRAWHNRAKAYMQHDKISQIFMWLDEGQDVIIEQWTGLYDKNGIEIYEGDIVTGTYYQFGQKYSFTGEVKYVITAFKVVGTKSYNGMHQELNSIYEIIGNIHTQKP
jgi:uncharacterized phage protein (TIGR01671 family)